MWIELISGLVKQPKFDVGVSADRLADAEAILGVQFPLDLSELLAETNGVEEIVVDGQAHISLVWDLDRIVNDNVWLRTDAQLSEFNMPFDNLLFFADSGIGSLFGYSITKVGRIDSNNIFLWDHTDDSRTIIAVSLKEFVEGWFTGSIKI